MPRITATAAQTGEDGIRSIQGALPFAAFCSAKSTKCQVIRIKTTATRTAAATSAICPARVPTSVGKKRIVILLRSTIATGRQQATENAATRELASRTASIGCAKKKRNNPSAIVITAKQSNTPRPRAASARASALLAQSIHCIGATFGQYLSRQAEPAGKTPV